VTTGITPETWACIGDSLTQNNPSTLTGTKQTWVSRIDIELFPTRAAANLGKNSDVLSQMRSRYDSRIVGKGYYGIVLWGGVNDILADATGAATFAAFKSFVDDALSRGMKVIAAITPPAGSYSGWSAGRQTQLEAFRALMLATFVDGYHVDFVGLVDLYDLAGDDADPTVLADEYEMAIPDGLHTGQAMQDDILLPTLVPLMAAPEAEVAHSDDVGVFGVVADDVRRHYFPALALYDATTSPTETTVDEMIAAATAKLLGKLALKSITIENDSSLRAYKWCADTVRLHVATRIPPTVSGVDPEEHNRWKAELKERYTDLSEGGADVLGEGATASASSTEPEGPVEFLTELGIDTGDAADASSAIPRLRYDDEL
jgi:hypothetical protein